MRVCESMETVFTAGDLVWVCVPIIDDVGELGIVTDVRPWVLGGTSIQSSQYGVSISNVPKRSEYLIISPEGNFHAWFDENSVFRVNTIDT